MLQHHPETRQTPLKKHCLAAEACKIIANVTESAATSNWNIWSSKLLYASEAIILPLKISLRTVAMPPPRPDVLGVLKKEQSAGTSSLNGLKSQSLIQVSVIKRMSRLLWVKKSRRMKVLFASDRTLSKDILRSVDVSADSLPRFKERRNRVLTPFGRDREHACRHPHRQEDESIDRRPPVCATPIDGRDSQFQPSI